MEFDNLNQSLCILEIEGKKSPFSSGPMVKVDNNP